MCLVAVGGKECKVNMKRYLVLDIGGSSIKYALIQENLEILEKYKETVPLNTLEDFVEKIGSIYDLFSSQINGIAISMPGIIDPDRGYSYTGGSFHYINKLETVKILQKRCPTNITIGNDAKCAANAEIGFGSLKDIHDGAVIILGTGIGGCLIKDGKVHTGHHYSAGEFSFMKTNCLDPISKEFAWSTRNGISGLLKRVQERLNTTQNLTGEEIFALANQGNKKIIEAIEQFSMEIATQIFNIHTIFDCEKIAIGGGISVQPLLIKFIKINLNKIIENLGIEINVPEVVSCFYYSDANLIGALYQHIQIYKNEK